MKTLAPVKPGAHPRLRDIDPDDTGSLDKEKALKRLEADRGRIAELQTLLYAENRQALLVVLQGMDTSGKDGTIKHVFSAVNPVGCEVTSFGPPSAEELDHDFLWRIHGRLPRRGNIGVFNRSHYEDVLVVRVKSLVPEDVWRARYEQINRFEELVSALGTKIIKIFLHISRDEQKERLRARLTDPAKSYKFRMGDLDDRKLWPQFEKAYEDVLDRCSTREAPWYIVPANHKWYRNVCVARIVVDTLAAMDPRCPKPAVDPRKVRIPS